MAYKELLAETGASERAVGVAFAVSMAHMCKRQGNEYLEQCCWGYIMYVGDESDEFKAEVERVTKYMTEHSGN